MSYAACSARRIASSAARPTSSWRSSGSRVPITRWISKPGRRIARAIRRPGFEIQRLVGTREPDERQLEVGRAALAEILRAEGAAA